MEDLGETQSESRPNVPSFENAEVNIISALIGFLLLSSLMRITERKDRLGVLLENREFIPGIRVVQKWFVETKLTKKDIAAFYDVDPKTLNTWLNNYTTFNSVKPGGRNINLLLVNWILQKLGNPERQKVMSKKELNEILGTSYKTTENEVVAFWGGDEFAKNIYKQSNLLPPKVLMDFFDHIGLSMEERGGNEEETKAA